MRKLRRFITLHGPPLSTLHVAIMIVGPDVEWRELVSALDGEDAKPSVIVLMHAADSRLWAEIMSAGVFDAMTVSVDRERLQWTLAAAYRRWGRKQLVRQAIAANPMVQEA